MSKRTRSGLLLLCVLAGCDSSSSGDPAEQEDAGGTTYDSGAMISDAGAHDSAVSSDAAVSADAAAAVDAATGSDAATDAGASDAAAASGTSFTGTLGALGAVLPTVGAVMISNSGETLLYFSSAPLSCADVAESRWLGKQPVGSQVVEIVVKGAPKVQTYTVGPAEVNYAPGSKSSAYEKSASSGSVTFTKASAAGPVEGTVTATYANPTGNLSGSFSAEFCAGGQQY